jgi:hypothetical protein
VLLQVALSLPLLIGAVLLLRTLQNLRGLDTGFDRNNVLLASVNPSLNGYSADQSRNFFNELLDRTRALPGVTPPVWRRIRLYREVGTETGSWSKDTPRAKTKG